ncbi:glycoside hydrolase family 31 protein [Actinomadura logoneensis]|uniref:glycoside hydrolase family 31 protein n=1 Tax=Actinomadura logoneensis TaxID=2293572 RepID=UPI0018F130E0|nr:glycoside hydrolase family 31 protein [Actinomadura logoneensis]
MPRVSRRSRPVTRRRASTATAAALVLAAPLTAVVSPSAHAESAASTRVAVRQDARTVTLATPGYEIAVAREPFAITTRRAGRTVLATAASGAFDVTRPDGTRVTPTKVASARWSHGTLDLSVATSDAATTLTVAVTPSADRYRVRTGVKGASAASATALHLDMASGGHWYGHGEAKSDAEGEPDTRQPWPLDAATGKEQVNDTSFGPASYLMTEPFWFTATSAGLYVDTGNLMRVSLGRLHPGVADFEVTDTASLDATFFVERTPRAVYQDYIGIAGRPRAVGATPAQFTEPLWNSWAQFYSTVDQKGFLEYARSLHDAGVLGHTMQLDDGWMTHYGDYTWNAKFPDPKGMSDQIHAMGYGFGVWITQWINLDADNYQVAKDKGYLLKSKQDPSQPCTVTWWNGKAGLIDLGNPDAYRWYEGQLKKLQADYGVDGFKFDTKFFDERCAASNGLDAAGYRRLGAELAQQFDLQGAGIRVHWTGAQKYGFVTRTVDKGTDWASLNAAVKQNLAVSVIGYPFVATDMIGGSDSMPPPSPEVLVRWAQAAALMPIEYSSTSPLKVYDFVNRTWVTYPPEVARHYAAATRLHAALAPYIRDQADRAVRTGEPIMKPLFFRHPDDPASYTVADEWLLGDALLAAPVLASGTSRDVHLPPGAWYDVVRHRAVKGGGLRGYRADLGTVPLFVRLGTSDTPRLLKILE